MSGVRSFLEWTANVETIWMVNGFLLVYKSLNVVPKGNFVKLKAHCYLGGESWYNCFAICNY